MKCPYCAETIQDAAILCRFCGARKAEPSAGEDASQGGEPQWVAPPIAAPAQVAQASRGNATFRFAGVCFLLSAGYELFTFNAPFALAGAMRAGAAAYVYHALYAALFVAAGVGLLRASGWGLRAVLAVTLFYTVDKAQYVLDPRGLKAEAQAAARQYSGLISADDLVQSMQFVTLGALVCWWGFAAFVFLRRRDFAGRVGEPEADPA